MKAQQKNTTKKWRKCNTISFYARNDEGKLLALGEWAGLEKQGLGVGWGGWKKDEKLAFW